MAKIADRIRVIIARLWQPGGLREGSVRAVAQAPRALAVIRNGPDRDTLQGVFRDAGWQLEVADTPAAAFASQQEKSMPIVLYERELTERGWCQAISVFSRQSPRPCLVLLSRTSDMNLWDELVRCGGFDLLRIPIDRDAVIRTVRAGWSVWKGQQSRRQPAAKKVAAAHEAISHLTR
jgi:DNA-binding NtrC family response regulator